jgi:hypothetical protein
MEECSYCKNKYFFETNKSFRICNECAIKNPKKILQILQEKNKMMANEMKKILRDVNNSLYQFQELGLEQKFKTIFIEFDDIYKILQINEQILNSNIFEMEKIKISQFHIDDIKDREYSSMICFQKLIKSVLRDFIDIFGNPDIKLIVNI